MGNGRIKDGVLVFWDGIGWMDALTGHKDKPTMGGGRLIEMEYHTQP